MNKLANKLTQDRENWKLTLKDQAERLKISPGTLSRLEQGKDDVTLKTVRRIARALGVSVKEIVSLLDDD